LVNYGFYLIFHEALGIFYLLANILAIEMSLISNFIMNERWTFRDRERAGRKSYFRRMIAFNFSSGLVAWFTQTPTLFILTHYFGMWDKAAVIIGIVIGALLNYFVSNYWIFRDKSVPATPP
jgi:dolichol-phosphate mannosyltransferase